MAEVEVKALSPSLEAYLASKPKITELIEKGVTHRLELLELLRSMWEIRCFEEKIYELMRGGRLKGASHLSVGQEAVPVGAISAIRPTDLIASTHRGHGHCGAMGNKQCKTEEERQAHWNQMMAELMGKQTGYCHGRGGSMHIADVERGNLGATGIVAGNIPVATGAALAEKLKGTDAVVLCFFGDGAANTGAFHEAVNFGATILGGLPVVYICENNLYGMSVPWYDKSVELAGRASNVPNVADRASAYGIPGKTVDGMDVLEVKQAVAEAVERARRGGGPSLIECKCYRYYGHSFSDARAYRTKEEEAFWRERDPIETFEIRLLREGLFTREEIERVQEKAKGMIEKATQFAFESPLPDPKDLYEGLYIPRDPEVQAELKAQDESLRARLRPIENEIRTRVREMTGPAPKGVLGPLRRELVAELEAKYGVPIIAYNQALADAQAEEMERDPSVFLLGEDIGIYGGAYAATRGLIQRFGPQRVIDTPISEAAVAGAAVGAAMRGMRPVAEIMYIDFATIASDQIIHNMAYNRYMFGGKTKVPAVIRTEGGVGRCLAATHSESLESWFVHIPGLTVIAPSTPYDAKGLLKSAIRDDNPVMFIEHKLLYSTMGPVPKEEYLIPIGVADIKKPGKDITLVAYSRMVHFALEAAWDLEEEGISVEVIDPRTLKPLDVETIALSVRKTGRLITLSEAYPKCGMAGEIIRQVLKYEFPDGWTGFDCLDAPPIALSGKDCPIPMSEPLEDAVVPSKEDIIAAVKSLL